MDNMTALVSALLERFPHLHVKGHPSALTIRSQTIHSQKTVRRAGAAGSLPRRRANR